MEFEAVEFRKLWNLGGGKGQEDRRGIVDRHSDCGILDWQ